MKPDKYTFEEKMQVRAHSLIAYTVCHPRPERKYRAFDTPTYSGKMTDHAAKRIRKAIDIFLQLSPERWQFNPATKRYVKTRLSFVTLTVSQDKLITPTEGYEKLLAPWLRWLRAKHRCDYVWKGELQKRGQPHWHVTINTTIHHSEIRNAWNNLQNRAGLVEEFAQKFGHRSPPSTEIKNVQNARRIALYLGKEFCKANQQTGWTGKIWGCSENIRQATFYEFSAQDMDATNLENALQNHEAKRILCDRITIYDAPTAEALLDDNTRFALKKHLSEIKKSTPANEKK